MRVLAERNTSKANQVRRTELIATEEVGTEPRRQIGAIAARAYQAVQPALRQMRVGILAQHRESVSH